MRLSFFTRRALAKQLGVSDSRVSQMQSSGELVAPETFIDDTVAGWPSSYVESVAGTRRGHRVSPSIYGLLPPSSPLPRTENLIVPIEDNDVHVQVFRSKAFPIALIAPLSQPAPTTWPEIAPQSAYARSLDVDRTDVLRPDTLLAKAVRVVADQLFERDVFACAWLVVEPQRYFTGTQIIEVVISDEHTQFASDQFDYHRDDHTGRPARTETSELSFQAVAEKLGRPVPLFPPAVGTREIVERWLAEGGTEPVRVVVDSNGDEEVAAAAVILNRLDKLDDADRSILCSALMTKIDWESSNQETKVFYERPNDQSMIELTAIQVIPDLKGKYQRYLSEIGEWSSTAAEAQEVADRSADLIHEVYGEYGAYPAPSIAAALNLAISALHARVSWDSKHTINLIQKHYHAVRAFRPDRNPEWDAYCESLTAHQTPETPAERELYLRTEWGQIDPGSRLFRDAFGVPATVSHVQELRDERPPYEIVAVAVPIISPDLDPAGYAEFESIVIAPNTQEGPVLLSTPDGYRVMPFTTPSPGGFTHGYGGSGPSNLITAIQGFVEWATGQSFTTVGHKRLQAVVISSYQYETLMIDRRYLTQPGSLEPHALPDGAPLATDPRA